MVENELDAYIGGFHLDALTSGVSLNVDLDTTLTVVAGNLYRLLAQKLSRYEKATPETLWRDFLDATGTLHIDDTGVTCALHLRSHHPALIDAGFAEVETPMPRRATPSGALSDHIPSGPSPASDVTHLDLRAASNWRRRGIRGCVASPNPKREPRRLVPTPALPAG